MMHVLTEEDRTSSVAVCIARSCRWKLRLIHPESRGVSLDLLVGNALLFESRLEQRLAVYTPMYTGLVEWLVSVLHNHRTTGRWRY